MRLSEIDLGLDGVLYVVSRLDYDDGRILSGLTNLPFFLVQLHAPSVPFRDSLCMFAHLASRALPFEASEMALSRHLL